MRRALFLVPCLALVLVALPEALPTSAHGNAQAQDVYTIRLATLAPRGTAMQRTFARFQRRLSDRTGGRLRLHVYYGGVAGGERSVVRKMRNNQLDAASVTTTGLGMIVREAMVLSAPGVIENYAQLDAVRTALAPELAQQFEDAGFKLLGWGDAGRVRLFSDRRIMRPRDMRSARVWVWRDNPIFVATLRAMGVTGVPLGIGEVLGGLSTGRIDTFPASAIAAVGLQWFNHARFVSAHPTGIVVGATVMRKSVFDAFPADIQTALMQTARESERAVQQAVRTLDDRAYATLIERGMTPVDASAHRAEWQAIGERTRQSLRGRLFQPELLERVERIAAQHR
ncbi:MAG: TRAP transporter substrate-binding protein DctP [Deltaproteobacteria bacterium]|nr:TRAP transporter substrate-binding protein DctP [Deltaproteobacteria bacterium]